MGSRKSRIHGAAAALVGAMLVAACGSTAATPSRSAAPSGSSASSGSPAASASMSTQPTATASAEIDYGAAAKAIVEALGGTVPPGTSAVVTYGDASAGSSSVHVALGDWQMAWDARRVLRHVFWEQSMDGATPPPSANLSEAQILARVGVLAAALKLDIGAPKEVVAQEGAWMAAWPRLVDGVPAEENGTRFWLNNDGTFLQYTYGWNDLAPKPTALVSEAQATQAVDTCRGGAGPAAKCEATLVWHLQSTAAADDPLSLCWIVGPKGGGGDWRVWVDAGTGEVVDVAAQLN